METDEERLQVAIDKEHLQAGTDEERLLVECVWGCTWTGKETDVLASPEHGQKEQKIENTRSRGSGEETEDVKDKDRWTDGNRS